MLSGAAQSSSADLPLSFTRLFPGHCLSLFRHILMAFLCTQWTLDKDPKSRSNSLSPENYIVSNVLLQEEAPQFHQIRSCHICPLPRALPQRSDNSNSFRSNSATVVDCPEPFPQIKYVRIFKSPRWRSTRHEAHRIRVYGLLRHQTRSSPPIYRRSPGLC